MFEHEKRLRQVIRETLCEELFGFGKQKTVDTSTVTKTALDAFVKALELAFDNAYPKAKTKIKPTLANLRSQLEQTLGDTARYLAAQG